jgi:hypothetical protein
MPICGGVFHQANIGLADGALDNVQFDDLLLEVIPVFRFGRRGPEADKAYDVHEFVDDFRELMKPKSHSCPATDGQVQSMLLGGRVVLRLVTARGLGCGPSRLRQLLANTR